MTKASPAVIAAPMEHTMIVDLTLTRFERRVREQEQCSDFLKNWPTIHFIPGWSDKQTSPEIRAHRFLLVDKAKEAIQKKEDTNIFNALIAAAEERGQTDGPLEPAEISLRPPGVICPVCANHDYDEEHSCNSCGVTSYTPTRGSALSRDVKTITGPLVVGAKGAKTRYTHSCAQRRFITGSKKLDGIFEHWTSILYGGGSE